MKQLNNYGFKQKPKINGYIYYVNQDISESKRNEKIQKFDTKLCEEYFEFIKQSYNVKRNHEYERLNR